MSTAVVCKECVFLGPFGGAQPPVIEWHHCRCIPLGSMKDANSPLLGFQRERLLFQLAQTDVVLQPTHDEFPAWDFVVVKSNGGSIGEISFVQVTVSGDVYASEKALQMDDKHKKSLIESGAPVATKILDVILPGLGIVVAYTNNKYVTTSCPVAVRFIFVTKAAVEVSRTSKSVKGNSYEHLTNLEVVGETMLRKSFGIQFN
jgi:hypothetical protein